MRTRQVTLGEAGDGGGVVVVVDVLRAFTVAAVALARGADAIRCVATVEEALEHRAAHPGSLAMGEVGGYRPEGFDLSNSPTEMLDADVSGRLLIQRTSAGTQGLVAASGHATSLFASSFACAGATARAVAATGAGEVTFVLTGVDHHDGDEDRACADYITALLEGETPDPAPYLDRVRAADAAQAFLRGDDPRLPASDVDHATDVDSVDFALEAHVESGSPVLRTPRSSA